MTFINLGEWPGQREFLTPERIGLIDGRTGARFSYRALNLRARALAAYLKQSYHIRQRERVAVLAFNAPEYLDVLFACALLGAILVPLHWRLSPRTQSYSQRLFPLVAFARSLPQRTRW